MTDHMIHALLALLDGPTFGYDILRRMRKRGHKIETGTLYGSVIPRLEKRGYLEVFKGEDNIATYKWAITQQGKEALNQAMHNMAKTTLEINSAFRESNPSTRA